MYFSYQIFSYKQTIQTSSQLPKRSPQNITPCLHALLKPLWPRIMLRFCKKERYGFCSKLYYTIPIRTFKLSTNISFHNCHSFYLFPFWPYLQLSCVILSQSKSEILFMPTQRIQELPIPLRFHHGLHLIILQFDPSVLNASYFS